MNICVECKQPNALIVIETEGTVVCQNCGRVNAVSYMDEGAEWRNFQDEEGEDPSRVGLPNNELLTDKGLGTMISDSALKRWNQRSQLSSLDSALLKTFTEIEQICNGLTLNSCIKEHTKKLFKQIYTKKLTRGKSHMGVVCACIFITCRKFNNRCPVADIAHECSVDEKKLQKAYMVVKENCQDVFPLSAEQKIAVKNAKSLEFTEPQLRKLEKVVEEIAEFYGHKMPEIVAVLGVFIVDYLEGKKREYLRLLEMYQVDKEKFVELYRYFFKHKFRVLRHLFVDWDIADLPNI